MLKNWNHLPSSIHIETGSDISLLDLFVKLFSQNADDLIFAESTCYWDDSSLQRFLFYDLMITFYCQSEWKRETLLEN